MVTPELLDYIRQFLDAGQGADQIKKVLVGAGWSEADVDEAIKKLGAPAAPGDVSDLPKASTSSALNSNISNQTSSQPRRFNKILFSAIVVVLVLLAGGAYAYYFYISPSPEVILDKMVHNLKTIKTTRSETVLKVDYSGQDLFSARGSSSGSLPTTGVKGKASLQVKVTATSDIKDEKNPRVAASFNVESGGDLVEVSNIRAGVDLVVDQGVGYLRLNTADFGMAGDIFDASSFTETIKGKWIKVDLKELEAMGGGSYGLGESNNSSTNNQVNLEKITEIFKKHRFLKVGEVLPDEVVDGESAYHYRLKLDRDKLTDFIVELGNYVQNTSGTMRVSTDEVKKQMDNSFNFIDKYVSGSNFDIWITKKDKLPKKVLLGAELKDTESDGKLSLSLDVSYSGFNEPVEIKAPENAESIEDVFASITSQHVSKLLDQNRISDLSTLKSAISLYLADVSRPHLCDDKNTIYASGPITPPKGWKLGKNTGKRSVDGLGWIPINLNEISSGAPISWLPIDPQNGSSSKSVYLFACDPKGISFELNAILTDENSKVIMEKDGGDDPAVFEVGTAPGLKLIPNGFWKAK